MTFHMILTHLSFTSPTQRTAIVEFTRGLNIVYGPSNTGKSSILDAIDFMLGRERQLKELPEHDPYNRVLLGVDIANAGQFTLVRNISGGDFECFDGCHHERPKDVEPIILKVGRSNRTTRSISDFILGHLDLGDKQLRRNQKNETERLTLRNFAPLFLISETNIQRETSPYVSEQYVKRTAERSRLKFFLTGVDDNSIVAEEKPEKRLSRTARLSLIEELMEEQKIEIETLSPDTPMTELVDQRELVSQTVAREMNILQSTELEYQALINTRSKLRQKIIDAEDRQNEVREMLARFELLDVQYKTDIIRLENLTEAGSLLAEFPSSYCPYCGSDLSDPNAHTKCDDDIEEIADAAKQERDKISKLAGELSSVRDQLRKELDEISFQLPAHKNRMLELLVEIQNITPNVSEQRTRFAEAQSKISEIDGMLRLYDDLNRLENHRRSIENEAPESVDSEDTSHLPTKALFNLSEVMRKTLRAWNFPNSNSVHFDKDRDDFVIDGKHRASNGKGHRALTHAAATLSLMKYCETYGIPYTGFILLDSPLLAYEKPEDDTDGLSETNVNAKFLQYLERWTSRQVIVFENQKSLPNNFKTECNLIHFTGIPSQGRFGFFPLN